MFSFFVVVVAGIFLYRLNEKLSAVQRLADELRDTVTRLSRQVAELSRTTKPTDIASTSIASSAVVAPPSPPPISAPVREPAPPPRPAAPRPAAPRPAPERQPAVASERSAAVASPPSILSEAVARVREVLDPGAPPPRKPPTGGTKPPTGGAAEPPTERPRIDWEGFIGVKLFSWIAGGALALAGVFFIRHSMDSGWLQPPVRLAIGVIVGIGLLVGCELKAARRYPQTANALDAAGIALLFTSFFAAHALWDLIPALGAFALLALVTTLAVILSVRRESIFIAILGLIGGFATPVLLASGQNNPIGLFGYLLLLNAGLSWVAYRKGWPLLTVLSLLFTTLYQWGWATKFLTASTVPLAVGIFLLFAVFGFVALALGRRDEPNGSRHPLFDQLAGASAALPLLFAVYLAVVPAYGARFGILFGFLFLLDAGLFALAVLRGPQKLHLLGAVMTVLIFAVWTNGSYTPSAWPWVFAFVALFALFYLGAPLLLRVPLVATRIKAELTGASTRAAFAAPLLLFVFPALIAIEPRAATATPFVVLLLLSAACTAYAVVRHERAIHFLAAFFAVFAEVLWAVEHFSDGNLLAGLAVFAAFALFYIAAPTFARRQYAPLGPQGASSGLLVASIALLFTFTDASVAGGSLWAIALLLAILNVGLYHEAGSDRAPVFTIIGTALSWLVLATWWMSASVSLHLLPALVVLTGFTLLTLGVNIWAKGRAAGDPETARVYHEGIVLGLVGHLFLFYIAARTSLSVPPWPMLGVLGVLNLAVATAALSIRDARIHLGAAILAPITLLIWVTSAGTEPWPAVAVAAAGALAALAFGWLPLARRMRIELTLFQTAAAAATVLAQMVAVHASTRQGTPSLAFLLVAQLAFIASLLALAIVPRFRFLALVAVATSAIAGVAWQSQHPDVTMWRRQLAFVAPLYLAFMAYPLVLGRRVGSALEPYLAAVLASAVFFLEARHSLVLGGHGGIIGALPVVQAALVAVLLRQLLQVEPPGARTMGRLALVAGAALAFITVAIPLQLEKNWITIAWAVEGAALAWLYRRIPHRGLLLAVTGLFVVVFIRLAVNPSVLTYEPRGSMRILNWYLYTYLICAGSMLLGGWLLAKTDDLLQKDIPRLSSLLPAGGAILLFLLLNIEIADFYATGPTITFNFTATLAQDLTYTLGWAVFAVGLLAAGIALRVRPARMAAIGLLTVAVIKAFLHDLGRLGGLYRVGSFVGLAICLALVAIALQKFVMTPRETR